MAHPLLQDPDTVKYPLAVDQFLISPFLLVIIRVFQAIRLEYPCLTVLN